MRADLDQKELALLRDATEKKLQLAKSTKVAEVNGKRQVIADKSITLDNSAPMVAAIFADRQQQIEDQRAADATGQGAAGVSATGSGQEVE